MLIDDDDVKKKLRQKNRRIYSTLLNPNAAEQTFLFNSVSSIILYRPIQSGPESKSRRFCYS